MGALTHEIARYGQTAIGVDLSSNAIRRAKEMYPECTFIEMDIIEGELDESFDIIIDSHLLHCFALEEDRIKYLNKLSQLLNNGGIIIIETMVESKAQLFPESYSLRDSVLYKNIYNNLIPYRCIKSISELENEMLKLSELKIETLHFPYGMKFQIDQLPIEQCPDVAQILLKKRR